MIGDMWCTAIHVRVFIGSYECLMRGVQYMDGSRVPIL